MTLFLALSKIVLETLSIITCDHICLLFFFNIAKYELVSGMTGFSVKYDGTHQ